MDLFSPKFESNTLIFGYFSVFGSNSKLNKSIFIEPNTLILFDMLLQIVFEFRKIKM